MIRTQHLSSRRVATPITAAVQEPEAQPRTRPSLLLTFLLGLSVLLLADGSAKAQFNGPTVPLNLVDTAQPTVLTTDPAILYPPIKNNPVRPGDILTIRLFGDETFNFVARVDQDGTIKLPGTGTVHVEGLTLQQAEDFLAEKLVAAGQYIHPQLLVTSADGPGQYITVIGDSKGLVPAIGRRKLLETLSIAGGISPTTSHIITIHREGVPEPIVVDIGTDPLRSEAVDIPVFAGDLIVTSRAGIIYLLGGFKTTGTIPLNGYGPLTMTQLIALSGGPTIVAKNDDLRIIRTVGNRRTVATFDVKKIMAGKAPDPILMPNDIVYMPNSAWKSFFLGGTLNTFLSFLSLGISLEAIR